MFYSSNRYSINHNTPLFPSFTYYTLHVHVIVWKTHTYLPAHGRFTAFDTGMAHRRYGARDE